MIDWLRAVVERRRFYRKRMRRFEQWLAANPGGTYSRFYSEEQRRRIDSGERHVTLGIASVDQAAVKARAQRVLSDLKRAGCRPDHVVVDYGCGSLWVGEALMGYLQPGNFIGLDVTDLFYAEGLARLPAELVASRRPMLRVIGEAALREVRERRPDFIISLAVLHHVPPNDLDDYFTSITSLAGPGARIEIGHRVRLRTRWVPPRRWEHSRYAVRSALAPVGYAAEYRPERRMMPTTAGFSIVRR